MLYNKQWRWSGMEIMALAEEWAIWYTGVACLLLVVFLPLAISFLKKSEQ